MSHNGHRSYGYMDLSSDQELDPDQLPKGETPIWIQPPSGTSHIKMMERALQIPELKQCNKNVTVLYDDEDDAEAEVMDVCKKFGYKYIVSDNMAGAEDQAVILLNSRLFPETITRGINMLIIVTDNR